MRCDGPGASGRSSAGFNADAGLAEREISMGDDFGRSDTSSMRAEELSGSRGGVGTKERSDSLDGEDELSVAMRSLSRQPRSARDARRVLRSWLWLNPRSRSLPLSRCARGDGSVKDAARGEDMVQPCTVGLRRRRMSGTISSLDWLVKSVS